MKEWIYIGTYVMFAIGCDMDLIFSDATLSGRVRPNVGPTLLSNNKVNGF